MSKSGKFAIDLLTLHSFLTKPAPVMILIADSGSTKCHWAVVDANNDIRVATDGLNPFFTDADTIEQVLRKQLIPHIAKHKIDTVHFLGAGCRDDKKELIYNVLMSFFPTAKISVDTDLKGAAIALFGNKAGIACILGTGSISCLYDGETIVENHPALGYILGDEGSGAVLGKKLLGDCFKQQMPKSLTRLFLRKHPVTVAELIDRVYCKPQANRYLASFTPFLKDNISEPYVYNLVFDSFLEFFKRNIEQYPHYHEYEVSFCGSIAYHFADVLEVAAYEAGLNFGRIVQNPIDDLVEYFRKI